MRAGRNSSRDVALLVPLKPLNFSIIAGRLNEPPRRRKFGYEGNIRPWILSGLAIEAAREHGDLRENAEYHMAKDEQKFLLARQSELQADIMRAKPTDFSDAPTDSIGIGSIVELEDQSDSKSQTYTVLGAWDSDPENNVLSYLTPLGQMLLGKKISDIVETDVAGNIQTWKVKGLSRWLDRK